MVYFLLKPPSIFLFILVQPIDKDLMSWQIWAIGHLFSSEAICYFHRIKFKIAEADLKIAMIFELNTCT